MERHDVVLFLDSHLGRSPPRVLHAAQNESSIHVRRRIFLQKRIDIGPRNFPFSVWDTCARRLPIEAVYEHTPRRPWHHAYI